MSGLAAVAAALVAPGRGILAADESTATLSLRLGLAGVAPTADSLRAWRELLVTAPGLGCGISGVILTDEALGQPLPDGRLPAAVLAELGVLTGIRADTGATPLPGTRAETVTEGLDGLARRLHSGAALGARFARWRTVLRIGPGMPSMLALTANAQALARYAVACQAAGLVPIAETEVLLGGTHSLGQCETVTSIAVLEIMSALHDYGVDFGGVVLRSSMVLPGSGCGTGAAPAEVAEATLGSLNGLPAALAGVTFASGGQPPGQATGNLAALQRIPHLWPLTFCFGRALTGPALAAWRGEPGARPAAQDALRQRIALNVAAVEGRYCREMEADLSPV